MSRRRLALTEPDESSFDFTKFPRKTLRRGSVWFRQHRDRATPDRGAWHFASRRPGREGDGRFDLPEPHGVCYLASTRLGAVNELIGPESAERGWVDADLLAGRVVSRLLLPRSVTAADTTSPRAAEFRVTNEIATTERYDLTQAWSEVLQRAGFGGVHSLLRFTPGPTRGLALFGASGEPDPPLPGDPDAQRVLEAVEELGVEIMRRPAYDDVTILSPRHL